MGRVLLVALAAFALEGCKCQSSIPSTNAEIDPTRMMVDLREIASAPHPFGSARQRLVRDYILSKIDKTKANVYSQDFSAETPNPAIHQSVMGSLSRTMQGTNIYATHRDSKPSDCVVLIGSHYDTKHFDGFAYYGANDSGSSSAVLLELLRVLRPSQCRFGFVWFDGEESVLNDWYDGERKHPLKQKDNTYGSRFFADQLSPCKDGGLCLAESLGGGRIVAKILLDMVGHRDLRFSNDSHSTPSLIQLRDRVLADLGWSHLAHPVAKGIEDDHIPFLRRGIPSVNLIDFENTLDWHQPGDKISEISSESLVKSATLASRMASYIAANPKELSK
jgi:glutaminyl-peptide cyclotransferase